MILKKVIYTYLLCLGFSFTLLGQETSYILECTDKPLEQILEELEDEYQFLFSYKITDVKDVRVSANVATTSKAELLQAILDNSELDYEMVDDTYIVLTFNPTITGTVCVKVLDELSGEPLVAAHIYTAKKDAAEYADEEGTASITHRFRSNDELVISYVGYEEQKIPIKELFGKDCKTISLSIKMDATPMLVITDYLTKGIDLDVGSGNTILRPARMTQLPGHVDADVLGTVAFLPGISSPTSKTSDIYVRGGTPDQNLILWEDIPIYHAAHYFGMITAIDPYTVNKVNVFRGGFGAEYGGRTASVIDIKTLDKSKVNPQTAKSKKGLGSNMTHSYLYAQEYISGKRPTAISLSLRRSYDEIWQTSTFKEITKVNRQEFIIGDKDVNSIPEENIKINNDFFFIDTHAKISSQLTPKDRIEVAGLYARNRFSDVIRDLALEEAQRDSMLLNNKGLSVNLNHEWYRKANATLSTDLKGVLTAYDYKYEYNLTEFDRRDSKTNGTKENTIQDKQLQLQTEYENDKGQNIKLGYHLINYDIVYDIFEKSRNREEVRNDKDSQSNLHSLYFSYAHNLLDKLDLSLGLRSSYYNLSSGFYLEPRLRIAYKLNRQLSLSVNYGRHHQFVGQVEVYRGDDSGFLFPLWTLTGDGKGIPIQDANLYQLGAIYNDRGLVIDLQLYNKTVDGISGRASSIAIIDPGTSLNGESFTKGVDFLVKKRFGDFNSWLSYSYSKTEMEFGSGRDQIAFIADHDQTHVMQLFNQIKVGNFHFGVGYKLSTGLPFTELLDFKDTSGPGMSNEYELIYGDINANRLPSIQEVNLSGQYTFKPANAKWKGYLNFSITNLLDRDNIYDKSYFVLPSRNNPPGPAMRRNRDKINVGFMPNVNLRIEW